MDKNFARKAGLTLLGFAAAAVPMFLLLRKQQPRESDRLRIHGWPIRLLQVIFARYIRPWVVVEGLENLPPGSYLVAANHGYKSGVDGFILGHILTTYAHRVPRIVMTADHRNWMVRMERWVLHYYGIALLVPREGHGGLSGIMAAYLQESTRHAVIIFPAGRAETDPAQQLTRWSTGAVIAARKCGCPVVPVVFTGLPYDQTPETVISAALKAHGPEPPFRIHVRIGLPIVATDNPRADLENLRAAIAALLNRDPKEAPEEACHAVAADPERL